MALLTFTDLKECAQIYLQEWTNLSVKEEALIPTDSAGQNWISNWDNWLLPLGFPVGSPPADIIGSASGIDPIVTVDMVYQSWNTQASPTGGTFSFVQAGDGLRTTIKFNSGNIPSRGVNANVLATFRRTMFRDTYWSRTLQVALTQIYGRLLRTPPDISSLDDVNDPWFIVVQQAAHNALESLAMFLSGLGRVKLENMEIDMLRAAMTIRDAIDQLEGEIDKAVVARRWQNSPLPRQISAFRLPRPNWWM